MEKPNYLKEVAWFHIDSFNYVIKEGLKLACLDIDPVYTKVEPIVKISICDAELSNLQLGMDTRKHKRTVYPSETRMRYATYFAELKLTLKFEKNSEEQTTNRTFFVPLMLKSDLCLLHGLNEAELQNRKEDKNDPGGYFIVKGNERLIRMFVVPKRNYPLGLIDEKWKQLKSGCSEHAIFIASVKDHHSRSNIFLHFVNTTKDTRCASVEVRVFYRNRSYLIPFMILVKSLVNESDAAILREILKFETDDHFLKQCLTGMMQDMLCYNISNSEVENNEGIYSHNDAKSIIGELFSAVFVGSPNASFHDVCDHFLKSSVLIHLSDNEDKFKFLCFSICKLFSLVRNQCQADDLDNPVFQEIFSPGQAYITAVKAGATTFLNSLKNSVTKKMNRIEEGDHTSFTSIIKTCTNRAISLSPIVERMISTGNMPGNSHGLMSSTGYTVPVDRTNVLAIASQFVGVYKFSMKFYSKNMRKYYPESWGFLCPSQTPEGENTGLYNYLAKKCQIVGLSEISIESNQLYRLGVIPFFDPIAYSLFKKVTIFVDGKILGWIRANHIQSFISKIKNMRSNRKIPIHTEVVFIPKTHPQILFQGLYIFSSPCRMVRSVMNADTNEEDLLGSFEQLFSSKVRQCDESNDSNFLGMAAALLPFSENNPGIRNIFTCMKGKQAISFPFANLKCRADTKRIILTYPQSPMLSTAMYADYNWDDNPIGTNVTVAILSYSGFDMEDAIVLNRASVERGLLRGLEYRTSLFDFQTLAQELDCKVTELEFKRNPDDPYIAPFLDSQGVPYVGDIVKYDSPVLSVFSKKSKRFLIKKYESRTPAVVDCVRFSGISAVSPNKRLPEEAKKLSITYCIKRIPVVGDKFSNRHGQKGVCGALMAPEDLPFTIDGTVPDILFNPHGLPSRMSIGMCLEILASKSPDHNISKVPKHVIVPFQFTEKVSAMEYFGYLLKEAGLDAFGEQRFYSGTSGEQLDAYVFTGSVYYLRLHHFVADKYQVQSIAKEVDPRTQQPININKDGAIRVGEMEKDSLFAHGAMLLALDRLLHNSDECKAYICKNCHTLLYPVVQPHNPLERIKDLPENKYCRICEMADASEVLIPYVLVYLMTELSAVGIKMQFSI